MRSFSTIIFTVCFINLPKTTVSMRNVVDEAGIEGKIHVNIVGGRHSRRHLQPAILLTQGRRYSLFFVALEKGGARLHKELNHACQH